MSKLIKNQSSMIVIIPKDICRKLNWKDGPDLFINADPYNMRMIIE